MKHTNDDFEYVDKETEDLFKKVLEDSNVPQAKIRLLYRSKKKKSGDAIVFASICTVKKLMKYFAEESPENPAGLDYVIVIDKNLWSVIDDEDKKRVLRHELLHAIFVEKEETSYYALRDHTVKTFYEEIELESGNDEGKDPRWMERLALVAYSEYDRLEEIEKENKKKKKKK